MYAKCDGRVISYNGEVVLKGEKGKLALKMTLIWEPNNRYKG
jgi:hypothetical protein